MSDIKKKINDLTSQNVEKLVFDRRYIHKNPELSFEEFETSKYIKQRLDEMSVEYISGLIGTDVVAIINGKLKSEASKTLLIRADIDALPITEAKTGEYASSNSGIMHACGHDAHTAILLNVCNVLNSIKEHFSGTVKLVFQPGEETSGGAKPLIDAGILSSPDVDACIALHMDPEIKSGKVRIKSGSLFASPDDFHIRITGKGGHGAEPEKCIDPIAVASKIVEALLAFPSREINPFEPAVVSVGMLSAGNASNIIPETATIEGTARSLTDKTRSFLEKRIGEISKGICDAYNAKCEYEFIKLFPPLINNDALTESFCKTAKNTIGEENCIIGGLPTMTGEDFSYFAEKCPSVMFKLGCRNDEKNITYPLHSPMFDIDERALEIGVKLFSNFAVDFLNS